MPGGGRPFKDDPTSYQRTGIPCGNPQRYQSRGVIRMAPDGTPFRDQRNETPIEDIETEGERQLKELVKKQLETNVTLHEQLNKKKEFTSGAVFKPLQAEVVGQMTLGDYQDVVSNDRQVEELRLVGLTDDEIQLKLSHGNDSSNATSAKQKRYGIDETVHKSKLEEIDRKISVKLAQLAKPDTFSGMKQLSRQEMDLERAISRDRDKAKLFGCLLTKQRPNTSIGDPNHPINHLDDIVQEVMTRKRKNSTAVRREFCENDDSSAEECATVATCAEREDCTVDHTGDVSEMLTCEEKKGDVLDCYKSNPWVTVESVSDRMNAISSLLNPQVVSSESSQKKIVSIPVEEIEKARLNPEEIKAMPKFSNYEPGEPSKTLYIKNLSARVGESDLLSLFLRFQKPSKPKIVFKLMTGRMKGQAFVTFQDPETAADALGLTHGYQLKGRPVVVQFGRKPADRSEAEDGRDSNSTSIKS
ncbi:RNA-binding protein 41 [Lamellibrachia satsuma]|nr:RNA-binding protein 41 [Lamellibrachia satsuma]